MKINRNKVDIIMAKKMWTSSELARQCKVSRQTISMVLNGKACRADIAGKIAKGLGAEVTEILEED